MSNKRSKADFTVNISEGTAILLQGLTLPTVESVLLLLFDTLIEELPYLETFLSDHLP